MAADNKLIRFCRANPVRAAWTALLLAMPVAAALILWMNRGGTYEVDQIRFFLSTPGAGVSDLFQPQNGNLLVTTTLLYKISLNAFGASMLPFRLIHIAVLLGTCAAFFALLNRRVGPAPALAAAVVLLVFGSDWLHVVLSLGFTVLSSVGAGLAALLLVERNDRVGDVGASVMLTLSIASFSAGLAFAVAITVTVLLSDGWRRRWWVFAIPLALYLAWWIWARGSDTSGGAIHLGNVFELPSYAFVSLAAVLASLTGFNYDFEGQGSAPTIVLGPGVVFAVAAVVVVAAVLMRTPRRRVPVAFWAALAALLSYWALGTLVENGTSRTPIQPRYMFPGAVFVLMMIAPLVGRRRLGRPAALVAIAVVVTALLGNLALVRDGGAWYRNVFSTPARAQFTALDLARGQVADDYDPHVAGPGYSVISTPAGPYLRAAEEFGSPGFTTEELEAKPSTVRALADRYLVDGLGLRLDTAAAPIPSAACSRESRPAGAPAPLEVPAGSSLMIRSEAATPVVVARFGDQPSLQVGSLAAGQWTRLEFPNDTANRDWRVALGAGPAAVSCVVPGDRA